MPPNLYEVLALTSPLVSGHNVSQQEIKAAYKQALLQHHPDKSTSKPSTLLFLQKHTIDEITIAYKTLSHVHTRSAYDRSLRFQPLVRKRDTPTSHIGSETIDLDDLQRNDSGGYWYRSCRCGDKVSFVITEDELEKEAEHGEIIAGCNGCSLVLRVVFQEVQDD